MPKLVCRSCGQGVYTTAPFEQLFADERRCPRCSQLLFNDRRSGANRRKSQRRRPIEAMAETPGELPAGAAPTNGSSGNGTTAHDGPTSSDLAMAVQAGVLAAAEAERRLGDRRQLRRRREDLNPFQRASEAGWVE